jgi:iron complex transport system substrate-binding protein
MTRRAPRLLATALAAFALALGGCADSGSGSGSGDAAGSADPAASYPVTVGKITLDKRPEKIVVLSPSATEIIFSIGAGAQVTAVDDNSNYPPEAPKSDLSGFQPNAEAIAAKNPDLVVLSNDINKIVSQLEQLKIPVYVAAAAVTLDDAYREITDLGALTGHPGQAAQVVQKMKDDVTAIVSSVPQRAKRPTYYYELGEELYSVTSKTFIGSLFTMAGLDNIADAADPTGAKGGYPQLSEEFIVKANPDFVFLADTKCCGQSPDTVKARSGWAGITAVKKDQIVALDDDIASRWGPRVVDLLRTITAATAKATA